MVLQDFNTYVLKKIILLIKNFQYIMNKICHSKYIVEGHILFIVDILSGCGVK